MMVKRRELRGDGRTGAARRQPRYSGCAQQLRRFNALPPRERLLPGLRADMAPSCMPMPPACSCFSGVRPAAARSPEKLRH